MSQKSIIFLCLLGLTIVGVFLAWQYWLPSASQSVISSQDSSIPQKQHTPLDTNIIEETIDVQGSSMQPLLQNGEKVTLQKNYYNSGKNTIKSSDIVIFENPFDLVRYIKKVAIVPGDTVEVDAVKKVVTVNAKPVVNSAGSPYTWNEFSLKNIQIYVGADKKWKQDIYYLLGDNVSSSFDSREYGPVSLEGVLGKVTFPEKK